MTSSIKATIRAWWAPDHRISCPKHLWRSIVAELDRRGERKHEAGMFLLGVDVAGRREVREAVYYEELDSQAYATGVCVLHGDAFAKLWALCREKKLTVVADIHTHGGAGFQSESDIANPMVARAGHVAMIVPNFARWPINAREFGVYEYVGDHEWLNRSPTKMRGYFYTGIWS